MKTIKAIMVAVFSFCFLANAGAQDVRIQTTDGRQHYHHGTTTIVRERPATDYTIIRERSYHGYYRRPHYNYHRNYYNDRRNLNNYDHDRFNRDYENRRLDKDNDVRYDNDYRH
jgi:hypothetical protein